MIDIDAITKQIRNLAKSNYYQGLYSIDKNLGLRLFYNTVDFTPIQMNFLNYLAFYSNLFAEIYLGEIGDIVLENFIYEDAYSLWKSKDKKREQTKLKQPAETPQYTSQFIFRSKPKNKGQ
jgi:hypothetical protein